MTQRIALLAVLGLALMASLTAGKVWIGPADWFADTAGGWIMADLRLPRALLGASIGAVLGLSGAVLQGYLRNPLADPTVVGVSSSAALGGVVAIAAVRMAFLGETAERGFQLLLGSPARYAKNVVIVSLRHACLSAIASTAAAAGTCLFSWALAGARPLGCVQTPRQNQ